MRIKLFAKKGRKYKVYRPHAKPTYALITKSLSEIDEDAVEKEETYLGSGNYAKTYSVNYCGENVAIKRFQYNDVEEWDSFQKELFFFERLHHPNIVAGIAKISSGEGAIVMELAPLGDLERYLKEFGAFEWMGTDYALCACVARALFYLHNCSVIHADLKPANILVFSKDHAKLADFGLALTVDETLTEENCRGDVLWMAPEVYMSYLTTKADMYSFGMCLWSMASGKSPFKGLGTSEIECKVMRGERPFIPECTPENIHALIAGCWMNPIKRRWDAARALRELEGEYQRKKP